MIRCFHVTKRYGAITALTDISFQIDEGEFVCCIALNCQPVAN